MDEYLKLFEKMLEIRLFEEKVDSLSKKNLIGGTIHLCIGQEAVAVGAISEINEDDYVISNHRGHGHLLAKGADPKRLMAELLGKHTGYCGGRGGTQHLCAVDLGFLGTTGITGGNIPIATGIALALKLKKKKQIVLCFFGDGASNQGTFHESLNMASLWKLPIIYMCENNLYAMSTHLKYSTSVKNISIRAISYNMKGMTIDGMNVLTVKNNLKKVVPYVRKNKSPFLIEAMTYRFCGHSKSDSRIYRSRKEENEWIKKDPILSFKRYLIKNKIKPCVLEKIEQSIKNKIEGAVKFALESRYPLQSAALDKIYANT